MSDQPTWKVLDGGLAGLGEWHVSTSSSFGVRRSLAVCLGSEGGGGQQTQTWDQSDETIDPRITVHLVGT